MLCTIGDLPRLVDSVRQYRRRIAAKPALVILRGGNQIASLVEIAPTGSLQIRTIDKYGQILLVPDIELNTWWTNLGWTDDAVIGSYHAHGESEQYHSEIKTDMDVERLPSGKFETNELVLELALIAYNLLRMIGQESLRHKTDQKRRVKRRRIRTVIDNIIRCASHVTEHARQSVMALGRSNTWRFAFLQIWLRFATA